MGAKIMLNMNKQSIFCQDHWPRKWEPPDARFCNSLFLKLLFQHGHEDATFLVEVSSSSESWGFPFKNGGIFNVTPTGRSPSGGFSISQISHATEVKSHHKHCAIT